MPRYSQFNKFTNMSNRIEGRNETFLEILQTATTLVIGGDYHIDEQDRIQKVLTNMRVKNPDEPYMAIGPGTIKTLTSSQTGSWNNKQTVNDFVRNLLLMRTNKLFKRVIIDIETFSNFRNLDNLYFLINNLVLMNGVVAVLQHSFHAEGRATPFEGAKTVGFERKLRSLYYGVRQTKVYLYLLDKPPPPGKRPIVFGGPKSKAGAATAQRRNSLQRRNPAQQVPNLGANIWRHIMNQRNRNREQAASGVSKVNLSTIINNLPSPPR